MKYIITHIIALFVGGIAVYTYMNQVDVESPSPVIHPDDSALIKVMEGLQSAQAQFEVIKERYRSGHPKYQEALRKIEIASKPQATQLQIAQTELESIKERYRSGHPKYQEALQKVQSLQN